MTNHRDNPAVKRTLAEYMAALDAAETAATAYAAACVEAGQQGQMAVSAAVAGMATRAGMLAADLGSAEGWQRWGELCAAFFRTWEVDEPDPRADPAWWDTHTDNHGLDDGEPAA